MATLGHKTFTYSMKVAVYFTSVWFIGLHSVMPSINEYWLTDWLVVLALYLIIILIIAMTMLVGLRAMTVLLGEFNRSNPRHWVAANLMDAFLAIHTSDLPVAPKGVKSLGWLFPGWLRFHIRAHNSRVVDLFLLISPTTSKSLFSTINSIAYSIA